jgi:cation diffusion facilitator CzcD-associated flavoprotein CzcO
MPVNGHGLLPEYEVQEEPQVKITQQWHSQPRHLKIIQIGAGPFGLCSIYKMQRQLTDYELTCYEKNSDVGGTWYESMCLRFFVQSDH